MQSDDFKDVAVRLIRDAADNRLHRLNGEDLALQEFVRTNDV